MISTITKKNHPFFHDNSNVSYENTINIMQNFFENEFEKYYKKHKNTHSRKPSTNIFNESTRTFQSNLRQTRRLKNSFLTRKRKFPLENKALTKTKLWSKKEKDVKDISLKLVKNEDILKAVKLRFAKLDEGQRQTNLKLDHIIQNARDIYTGNSHNNYTNCFERSEKIKVETTSAFHPSTSLCWEKDLCEIHRHDFEFIAKNTRQSRKSNGPNNSADNTIDYFSFKIKPEMTFNFTIDNNMANTNINNTTNKKHELPSSPIKLHGNQYDDKNYLEDSKNQEEIENNSLYFKSFKDDEDEKVKPYPSEIINSDILMYKQLKSECNSLEDLNINDGRNDMKDYVFHEEKNVMNSGSLNNEFNKDELSVRAYSELDPEKKEYENELIRFNQQDISINTNNDMNDNQSEFSYKTDLNVVSKNKGNKIFN